MLVMALLPAASRAWAAQQGSDWVEICSAQGTRWVSLSTGEAGEPDFKPMGEHCAACHLQAHGLGLPSADALAWQLPERFDEAPAAFLQALRLLQVWRNAQSRGPPHFLL
jgi:hypothetical protein